MLARRMRNVAVLKSNDEQGIDSALVGYLAEELGRKNVVIQKNHEGDIVSLSVPRELFRKKLRSDSSFRRALRGTETSIQDIVSKTFPFRQLRIGDLMSAPVYVKDAKTVGVRTKSGTSIPVQASIARLQETLEDWGQVKIPAILLLGIITATVYPSYRLYRAGRDFVTSWGNEIEEATSSDAGLERVIQRKSGFADEVLLVEDSSTSQPADPADEREKGKEEMEGP